MYQHAAYFSSRNVRNWCCKNCTIDIPISITIISEKCKYNKSATWLLRPWPWTWATEDFRWHPACVRLPPSRRCNRDRMSRTEADSASAALQPGAVVINKKESDGMTHTRGRKGLSTSMFGRCGLESLFFFFFFLFRKSNRQYRIGDDT